MSRRRSIHNYLLTYFLLLFLLCLLIFLNVVQLFAGNFQHNFIPKIFHLLRQTVFDTCSNFINLILNCSKGKLNRQSAVTAVAALALAAPAMVAKATGMLRDGPIDSPLTKQTAYGPICAYAHRES